MCIGLGDLDEAEKYLRAELARGDPKITRIVETNLGLGLLRFVEGKEEEAKAHFEKCVNAFEPAEFTTMPLLHVEVLLHLTSLYAKEGRLDEARRLAGWAARLAETLKSEPGLAMASQARASVLLAESNRDGAIEAYEESLTLWKKSGWPYYEAKALTAYSETIAQPKPGESKKRLEQAAEIFRKLGAKRDLERAQAKLSAIQI